MPRRVFKTEINNYLTKNVLVRKLYLKVRQYQNKNHSTHLQYKKKHYINQQQSVGTCGAKISFGNLTKTIKIEAAHTVNQRGVIIPSKIQTRRRHHHRKKKKIISVVCILCFVVLFLTT